VHEDKCEIINTDSRFKSDVCLTDGCTAMSSEEGFDTFNGQCKACMDTLVKNLTEEINSAEKSKDQSIEATNEGHAMLESTTTPSHTDDDVEIVLNDKEMAAKIGVTKATTSFTVLNAFGLHETHELWRDKLELDTLKSIRTYQTLEFRTYSHDLYHYLAFTSVYNTKGGHLIVANSVYVNKVTGDTMIILLILK
jgi:hypothetical protein